MYTPLAVSIKTMKPFYLGVSFFTYALGSGIILFLGGIIDLYNYWLGLSILFLMLIFSYLIKGYFDFFDPGEFRRQYKSIIEKEDHVKIIRQTSSALLLMSLAALTGCMVLLVLAYANGVLNPSNLFLLVIVLLLSLFYSIPPFRLVYSGYGELIQAVILTNLTPAIGLLFQTGDFHRLLGMTTLPITMLFIAMSMALSLKEYAVDLKYERKTMITRMGWRKGIHFHNFLVLAAYLMTSAAALLGLPWLLIWPVFTTLPLAVFQIWLLISILNGGVPRWGLIHFSAYALVFLNIYLITFSLWMG
jgi:1,4-dihydroxy-2-naphthoate octaprenyltransferase